MTADLQKAFIHLVRLGIGHTGTTGYTEISDWEALKALAGKQGLTAVVLDGIERLKSLNVQGVQAVHEPPKLFLLEWIGETLQEYDYRYEQYKQVIAEMAAFYNSHDYKMMVLKGYACSLDWPKPEHRPCGDIDIWQFGKQKEADALLESLEFRVEGLEPVNKVQRIKIDNSHHHHTVFRWEGFSVENHYDFVNVHARKSSAELEKVFKELGAEPNLNLDYNDNLGIKKGCKIENVSLEGDASTGSAIQVYLPSPNLHALFLIRHMVSHFAAAEITLRQVLDWAFFVEKHTKEVDWKWLEGMLVKFHMKEFVGCINAICVEDLGFPIDIFPEVRFVPELKERVLKDILDPEYTAASPRGFLPRLIYKYKRWQGNAWKHEMCYGESRWSAFWSGIWAKILKPASI